MRVSFCSQAKGQGAADVARRTVGLRAASILLGLLAICAVRAAWPAPAAADRVISLGRFQGRELRATVRLQPLTDAPSHGVTVSVRYLVGSGKSAVWSDAVVAGDSYPEELRTGAYRFTGPAGPKQLFVSATLGRVTTHVYKLSGKRATVIYSREDGRVVIRPVQNRSGGYDLEEHWPRRQWEDHDDLGEGRYDAKTNCVVRRLRWNNGKFVPYHPGRSKPRFVRAGRGPLTPIMGGQERNISDAFTLRFGG